MKCGFFGARAGQRFFAYHEPTASSGRPRAVLLCNPGPQEYRQCHFVLRRLADRLADAGLHVMRFDYTATGDSAGATADGSIEQWTTDVDDAAIELRELSGVSRLALVGIRLGAAIATRAVMRGLRAQELVLWDPVVHGGSYLSHLEAVDERLRLDRAYPISDLAEADTLLGVPLTETQRDEIAAIDLLREPMEFTGRAGVFVAEHDDAADQLVSGWRSQGVSARVDVIADATLMRPVWYEDTLLARAIPAAIEARLIGGAA
jgi:uncharacterized protein